MESNRNAAARIGLFGAAGAAGRSIAAALGANGLRYRAIGGLRSRPRSATIRARISSSGIRMTRHRSRPRPPACKPRSIWSVCLTTASPCIRR
jgi:hypothetical protein